MSAQRRLANISAHLLSSTDDSEVIFTEHPNGSAQITLNRPAKLNTLTIGMIRAIHDRLRTWEQSDSVKFIVFNGSGGKAFCAGGDLTQVTDAAEGQSSFIRPEYELDSYIANYPKPSIAIWDGITMGGGVGLTINCTHKVATDKFTFAMPETKLGFFPDVGATQFLTKLPHYVGKYVALLAGRLSSGDATFCQLAQYYMPSNRIPDLMTILSTRTIHNVSFDLPHILHSLHEDPHSLPIKSILPLIEKHLSKASIAHVIQSLESDSSEWARTALKQLRSVAPSAVHATWRLMEHNQNRSYSRALEIEYRVFCRMVQRSDVVEGVTAVLIDKRHAPSWDPPTLEAVTPAFVDALFRPLQPSESGYPELQLNVQ